MTEWRRSSACEAGACVEVAHAMDMVLVRSSLRPDVVVEVTGAEWSAFLAGVRAGEFGERAMGSD